MRRLAAAVIAGFLSVCVLTGDGRAAEIVDVTCEQSPPDGSPRHASEGHPDLSQSFSPTVAGVLRWAIRLRSSVPAGGTVTSRVSYHPVGVDDPTGGLEVVTVSAEVPPGVGERWVEFVPPEPTAFPAGAGPQEVSIDVHLGGTGLDWSPCRWDYPGGSTYRLTPLAAGVATRERAVTPTFQFVVYGWCPATGC